MLNRIFNFKYPFIKLETKWIVKFVGINHFKDLFYVTLPKTVWVEKFGVPRFITRINCSIKILGFKFLAKKCIPSNVSCKCLDQYYEQYIWYSHYCNRDLELAKSSWSWLSFDEDNKWFSEFLIK